MALSTTSRRFEFVEGNSSKFWEIDVHGTQVTVRYGRISTHGQAETKSFADTAAADKHAAKKITEKIKKGYMETA